MLQETDQTDLCVCIGTPLSGMTADRIATSTAKRSLKNESLGTVIINPHKTKLDGKAVLRIWTNFENCLFLLGEKMFLMNHIIEKPIPPETDVFDLPYTPKGVQDSTYRISLDLRELSRVVICNPKAVNFGALGRVTGKKDGNYLLLFEEQSGPTKRILGFWWIITAIKGAIPYLPIVNHDIFFGILPEIKLEPIHNFPDNITISQSHYTRIDINSGKNKQQWVLQLNPPADQLVEEVIWKIPEKIHCTIFPFKISRTTSDKLPLQIGVTLKLRQNLGITNPVLRAVFILSFTNDGEQVCTFQVPILKS